MYDEQNNIVYTLRTNEKKVELTHSNDNSIYLKGDQRINNMGELEEYSEGYWQVIENRR